jgi:hypothetical protein
MNTVMLSVKKLVSILGMTLMQSCRESTCNEEPTFRVNNSIFVGRVGVWVVLPGAAESAV